MTLSKDDILKQTNLPAEQVTVPEWGGEVRIRVMSGTERDAFEASVSGNNGRTNLTNIRARLVAMTVVDDVGERLFTDAEAVDLGRTSSIALCRVFEAAQHLNGLTQQDVEDLAGNSPSG